MDPKPFCLFYSTFFMTGGIFPIGQFLTGTGKILQDFQSLGLIFRGKIQPSGHQAAPFTKREDLNYYDFTLNEENITAFNK